MVLDVGEPGWLPRHFVQPAFSDCTDLGFGRGREWKPEAQDQEHPLQRIGDLSVLFHATMVQRGLNGGCTGTFGKLGTRMRHLVYGSNMDLERLSSRIERKLAPSERKHAFLRGHDLQFNKQSPDNPRKGYANVVSNASQIVEGLVVDLTPEEQKKLDRFEGYPEHYDRVIVKVELDSGEEVDADTCVAQPNWTKNGLMPTKQYVSQLLAAADLLTPAYRSEEHTSEL